jgi:hypothetical protein
MHALHAVIFTEIFMEHWSVVNVMIEPGANAQCVLGSLLL